MSRSPHDRIGIGLGLRQVAVARHAPERVEVEVCDLAEPLDAQLGARLDAMLPPDAHIYECRLVLADDCLRSWVMPSPAGVRSLAELRQIAHARFAELYGESVERWRVAADWRTRGPILCAATPRETLDAACAQLTRRRVRYSITSALQIACADALASGEKFEWLCIVAARSVTLIYVRDQSIEVVRELRVVVGELVPLLERLAEEIGRLTLRLNLPDARQVLLYRAAGTTRVEHAIQDLRFVVPAGRLNGRANAAEGTADPVVAAYLGAVA